MVTTICLCSDPADTGRGRTLPAGLLLQPPPLHLQEQGWRLPLQLPLQVVAPACIEASSRIPGYPYSFILKYRSFWLHQASHTDSSSSSFVCVKDSLIIRGHPYRFIFKQLWLSLVFLKNSAYPYRLGRKVPYSSSSCWLHLGFLKNSGLPLQQMLIQLAWFRLPTSLPENQRLPYPPTASWQNAHVCSCMKNQQLPVLRQLPFKASVGQVLLRFLLMFSVPNYFNT